MSQFVPTMVFALAGVVVVKISAGQDHSLMLASNGTVYSSGWGRFGRLGGGNLMNRVVPDVLRVLGGARFTESLKDISAGAEHSLVVSEEGLLYGFGNNDAHQLG